MKTVRFRLQKRYVTQKFRGSKFNVEVARQACTAFASSTSVGVAKTPPVPFFPSSPIFYCNPFQRSNRNDTYYFLSLKCLCIDREHVSLPSDLRSPAQRSKEERETGAQPVRAAEQLLLLRLPRACLRSGQS
ncbi:hypothetical protein [Brevibacillus migulae]|uniref:hypothetical protein n=1 Tax=Brevibacillus migulae TaxID=1644114 RepID=UPI00106E2D46|nr:hypothetical protein [Brevibacillus migulae]